jgi:hypothetical protein
MRQLKWALLLGALVVSLAACGGNGESEEGELSEAAQSACTGSELSDAPRLPDTWPDMGEVTFTEQSTSGPTEIVEGYFEGDVQAAHDDFKRELEASGFTILFDEVEENDSEVSWKGEGRSGQVAIRKECDDNDKVYIKVTNRPG